MLYDCNRISYRIDRRLTGLAGPDYDAAISFGLPLEPEDSQYGKSRCKRGESHLRCLGPLTHHAERWFCELDWMVDGSRE